jgi:hypothetical protein
MIHHSKFSLFAFLALLCAAVSGCRTTNYLSTDPQTSEEILRASAEHQAKVGLRNGDTVSCYAVSIRQDSTRWRWSQFGREVALPTNEIASIVVDDPKGALGGLIGVLIGGSAGGLIGLQIADAANKQDPSLQNTGNVIGDFLLPLMLGLAVGGGVGALIGETNGTTWTLGIGGEPGWNKPGRSEPGSLTWDAVNKRWWDAGQQRWVYPPSDTILSHDTTQTKLKH